MNSPTTVDEQPKQKGRSDKIVWSSLLTWTSHFKSMPYIPGANRFVSHTVLGLLFKATPLHIRDQLKNPKPGFPKSTPYIPGANRFDPHTVLGFNFTWFCFSWGANRFDPHTVLGLLFKAMFYM
ncbi:MAG: hypothetical protein LKJ64_04265 [Lentilactobacillus buchneri]|nr:hypothetical protein [Lentilactobacillus buchneri]MCI2028199.1 hypothetical protein [Lentilactobacillus buchneri]